MPVTCEVTMSAVALIPAFRRFARLVEGQGDRVADRAVAAPEPEDDESTPMSETRAANPPPDAALTVTVAGWPTLTEPMSDSLSETCILKRLSCASVMKLELAG